jgi:hypothetical protein
MPSPEKYERKEEAFTFRNQKAIVDGLLGGKRKGRGKKK